MARSGNNRWNDRRHVCHGVILELVKEFRSSGGALCSNAHLVFKSLKIVLQGVRNKLRFCFEPQTRLRVLVKNTQKIDVGKYRPLIELLST